MLKLFQRETCPYCKPVRERLTELQVTYVNTNQPKCREERLELIEATGKHFIPALVDGEVVIAGTLEDNSEILDYIEHKYGKRRG